MKKYIIPAILILVVLSSVFLYLKTNQEDNAHEEFALVGLRRILTRTTDTTILSVEVYETEDELYYLIEYSAFWQEEIIYNYAFEGMTWGFTIYQGSMNDYPSYTSEFEDAKINFQKKTVFSQDEINAFISLINANQ